MASKTSPAGRADNQGSNAATIQPFNVRRPVPQQEIDRTSGEITQNTGY